jgi:hypothetical protein
MGCFSSKPQAGGRKAGKAAEARDKLFQPPKWKSDEPMTQAQLEVCFTQLL